MIRSMFIALCAATAVQAQSFEGAISMQFSDGKGRAMEMSYMVKDGKVRMEMPGGRGDGAGAFIMDAAAQKMLIIMAAQKMYIEQSYAGLAAGAGAAMSKGKPPTITSTGRKETIAGYPCEHYTVADEGNPPTDVCIARGLGAFVSPSAGGRGAGRANSAWERGLGENGFPLKVQTGDKVEMLVTSIEKKPLDAALFAPPAGYSKMDMGAMLRGRPPR